MPSKKYNLVNFPGEDPESRVPLVPEEAFQNGIPYNVKFIGAMDIPRPTSRVEIVAAMRRVRFEFKAKGIKKRKVTLTVSTDGIRTCVRKKNRVRKKQLNSGQHCVPDIVLESHPIYRIFYVSHDSQDVKIFSYIARETSSAVFHCVVFKASNKSQAMKVVRTVGQAFEVSHKLNGPFESSDGETQEQTRETSRTQGTSEEGNSHSNVRKAMASEKSLPKSANSPQKKIPPPINVIDQGNEFENDEYSESLHNMQQPTTPILKEYANIHEVKLLREKVEQSTQATNAAIAQVNLLRDQLQAESTARIEAQTRTHQLLQHNKELLDHLQSLVNHIQELEGNFKKTSSTCSISPAPLPQVMTTSFQEIESLRRQNAALLETILYENNRLSYPHYFMYSHHHPPPPPAAPSHLYSSLLINNPHIPFTPQTNSSSSSPSKFYDDFNNMFSRPGAHHPQPQTPTAVALASASRGPSGSSMAGGDGSSFDGVGGKSACGVDPAAMNRFLFERQMSPMRRGGTGSAYVEAGGNGNGSGGMGGNGGGGVQRSVSEKINHRSELMSQVQRSVWARHTTK